MIDQAPVNTCATDAPHAPLRIALAHDWLVARRGGELVLDAIANTLLEDQHTIADLYAMFDAGIEITPTIDALSKVISPLNNLPPALRRWQLFRYPKAIRQLSQQLQDRHQANPIDLIISTHSAAIKALHIKTAPPSPSIPHICYCHTPARYLWSQQAAYASPGIKGTLRTLGLRACTPSLRKWDLASADTVTEFIANSTHTASQIKEHYHRDSTVIHPPVRTDFFVPPNLETSPKPRTDALLLVSALEPYKRVDLAIDAAAIANRELLIIGTGSHDAQLRKHARKARTQYGSRSLIRFLGHQTDAQLLTHYQSASAFLFPQIEDFGITAVEAQACGCPVVARNLGGALDTVITEPTIATGSHFDRPTPEAIANAITHIPTDKDLADRCRANALRFSHAHFADSLRALIKRVC